MEVPIEISDEEYVIVQLLAASEGLEPSQLLGTLLIEQMFSDRRFYRAVVQILRSRNQTVLQIATASSVPLLTVFAALVAHLLTFRRLFENQYDQDPIGASTFLSDAAFEFLDDLLTQGSL